MRKLGRLLSVAVLLAAVGGCNYLDPVAKANARLKREGGWELVYKVDRQRLPPGETVDSQTLARVIGYRIGVRGNPLIRVSPGPHDAATILVIGQDEKLRDRIKANLASQGVLEFRILADANANAAIVKQAQAQGDVHTPILDARRSDDDVEAQYLISEADEIEKQRSSANAANEPPPELARSIKLGDIPRAEWVDVAAAETAKVLEDKDLVTRTLAADHVQKLVILGQSKARWVPIGRDRQGKLRVEAGNMISRPNAGGGTEMLVLIDSQNVGGKYLRLARGSINDRGDNSIDFEFNSEGARLFGILTGNNVPRGSLTRRLGIILDGELLSAPNLQSRISDRGQITGDFTREEVEWVVDVLNAGLIPSPFHVQLESEKQVAPSGTP
ncbi:MAG: hypothetical protein K8T91_12045 [Planctomycetes bacterium]|nr:hypothetical protein [Planctomycetota bacterium]